MKTTTILVAALAAFFNFATARADGTRADTHAPIGVMAEHTHRKGEWMFSYRFTKMEMEGNLQGSRHIAPDTIVTSEPNRFFGNPMMPPTVRVVPLEMDMDMHMLGMMYAPSDRITLMLMANYMEKSMDHVTYQGGMGLNTLGNFSTRTSGWGDTTLAGLIGIFNNDSSRLHAIAGVSLPTGDLDESGTILTPMNMQALVRLPYPMQSGSGTYDPILGLSYSGFGGNWGWGAQWRSTFRIQDNDENYRLGDELALTTWLSYLFADPLSASLRIGYYDRGNISGIDARIMAPVQTADPARQATRGTNAALGINLAGQHGWDGWRLGLEYQLPLQQSVDGPQLERDGQLVIGIQKSW